MSAEMSLPLQPGPNVCVNSNGDVHPEHDWSADNECPRCGFELYEAAVLPAAEDGE